MYKDEILAAMSHNLKTPLNSILLFSQTIKNKITNKKYKDQICEIERNSLLLLQMINDLLDYSNIHNKKNDSCLNITQFILE